MIVKILENINVYISEEERLIADDFLKVYEAYGYQGTLEGNRAESKHLRKATEVCRFCKKTRDETDFTEETHKISKLVGNSGVYSHDECNECNALFGKLETEFAASLGYDRTFDHIILERKAPGFESGNRQLRIKKMPNGNIILNTKNGTSGDLQVDLHSGDAAIKMDTHPFRPESVYRTLLKMALAILPENDVVDYDLAFRFLLNPEQYPELENLKKVIVVETDLVLARPFGIIFKKQKEAISPENCVHVFCLFTGHFMFQISVPGHVSKLDASKDIPYLPAPYFQLDVFNPQNDIVKNRSVQKLHSTEKIKRDVSIKMKFPTENLVAINLGEDFLKSIEKKMWD